MASLRKRFGKQFFGRVRVGDDTGIIFCVFIFIIFLSSTLLRLSFTGMYSRCQLFFELKVEGLKVEGAGAQPDAGTPTLEPREDGTWGQKRFAVLTVGLTEDADWSSRGSFPKHAQGLPRKSSSEHSRRVCSMPVFRDRLQIRTTSLTS